MKTRSNRVDPSAWCFWSLCALLVIAVGPAQGCDDTTAPPEAPDADGDGDADGDADGDGDSDGDGDGDVLVPGGPPSSAPIVGSLGGWVPSNITFEGNLVYATYGTAQVGGHGGIFERNGHNLVFRHNTLIGFDNVLIFREYASGHTIRGNVIEGLNLAVSDGGWNDMGYVGQSEDSDVPDTAADFTESQLAVDNDFDENCFVTSTADFLAFSRRYDAGGGVQSSYMGFLDGQSLLDHEVHSVRADDRGAVFLDFAAGDYRVDAAGPCSAHGAEVPPGRSEPSRPRGYRPEAPETSRSSLFR